jgi:hypothetical protein
MNGEFIHSCSLVLNPAAVPHSFRYGSSPSFMWAIWANLVTGRLNRASSAFIDSAVSRARASSSSSARACSAYCSVFSTSPYLSKARTRSLSLENRGENHLKTFVRAASKSFVLAALKVIRASLVLFACVTDVP